MTEAEKFLSLLIERLEECVQRFYDETSALSYETKTIYKNKHQTLDNIISHDIDVYYNNHIIRFSYYPHTPFSTAHSVLTCYVSFNKTDSQKLFYPLSQVFGFLGITPPYALTIPLILTLDSMTECFAYITEALAVIHADIKALSYDEGEKDALFHTEFDFACNYFKNEFPTADDLKLAIDQDKEEWYKRWVSNSSEQPLSPEEEADVKSEFEQIVLHVNKEAQSMLLEDKQKFLTFYFTCVLGQSLSAGYEAYMVGNYPVAIKKLKRLKNKTQYENLLIHYMENANSPQRHVPESIFKNLSELYQNGISKNNFKEALAVAPAMFIFGAPWVPLFLVLYFLFYCFENRDAIYLLGPLENAPSVIFPAMIMGILMIYFNAKRFYKLFFRKNYQKLTDLENATFSRMTHKFMKGMTAVCLIGSIVFLFLTVHQNVKLTENGFYDNTAFFSLKGPFYTYQEVDKLHYQPETPDGRGGTFPYSSYVIILKNGEKINVDQFDSCHEKFLNVFQEKGVEVEPQ